MKSWSAIMIYDRIIVVNWSVITKLDDHVLKKAVLLELYRGKSEMAELRHLFPVMVLSN